MRIALLAVLLLFPFVKGEAQYFQFSQYNFTEQRINPALVGATEYAVMSFDYRSQKTGSDVKLNSNFVSGAYPLLSRKTGRRYAGIGLSFLDDRSGHAGIFKTQEVALSYAANVYLDKYQTLTLGMKGLYQFRNINLDGLTTGMQYVEDRGFNEILSNGEDLATMRNVFFTLSAGLYWQQVDRKNNRIGYWGVSFFDFNKPDDSFYGIDSRLNATSVWQAGARIFERDLISIMTEILYTRSASNNTVNLGAVTRFALPGNDIKHPANDHLDLITKYVIGRSAIVGLQLWRPNFSVGVSYDFPAFKKNAGNLGAVEVGLQIRKLVNVSRKNKQEQGRKKQLAKKTTSKPVSSTRKPLVKPVQNKNSDTANIIVMATDSISKGLPVKKSLSENLQAKQDSIIANAAAGNITHQPMVLEKITLHFNFEFNSSDMDEESMQQIDDLSEALKDNEHLKIKLTGHTDNIGSLRFNQRLSVYRADEIKNYLIQKGIDPARIATDGKGMSEPLNENKTDEERAKNRRVELVILYEE